MVTADLRQVLKEIPDGSVDLVLLDVDNGPDFLVYADNAAIYRADFLRGVLGALRRAVSSRSGPHRRPRTSRRPWPRSSAPPPCVSLPVRLQDRSEAYVLHLAQRTTVEDGD